jgi:hypothetical protein
MLSFALQFSRLLWLLRVSFFILQMRHQIDQILEELWRDECCTSCPFTALVCLICPALAAGSHPCRCATR